MERTSKVGYSDVPDSLEKGSLEAQPLDPDACHVQPAQRPGIRSVVKRHWITLGALALTWFAFSYGIRAFSKQPHIESWQWVGPKVRPPPVDEHKERLECVGGTNWTTHYDPPTWTGDYPFGAETAFSLPLDSDALYLVSRGPFQHGLVNIEQSTEVADTVDVRVRIAYYDDKAFELATVCQLEGEENEYGVGIFTPRVPPHLPSRPHRPQYKPQDLLKFDVTLTLPAGSEGPLSVKKLDTSMPDYSQNIADLESVLFETISLKSSNGKLTVQSVTSKVGEFSLINGEIEGRFNVGSSLDLHTLNGGITPTVNLLHSACADASNLTIHTVNGRIDAEVSLTSEASTGGEFQVTAQSTHGEIGLKFTETPVDSVLQCHAESVVGKIEVELDSAFEGSYSLRSLLGAKLVSEQDDVEDPAGRGRQRVVTQNKTGGQIEGELRWVESDGSNAENEGYVSLRAVTASVELVV